MFARFEYCGRKKYNMAGDEGRSSGSPAHPGGLLGRLATRFHPAVAGTASDRLVHLDPRLRAYADKVTSAHEAVLHVRPGDHVFVGTACATPRALVAALEALPLPPADVELVHFLTDHAVPHDADGNATTRYRHRAFFVGKDLHAAMKQRLAEYVPIAMARLPEMLASDRIPVDASLIQVSMPDEYGYVSLGVSVDMIPAAVGSSRLVIAEVNPAMPRTMGESMLHVDNIHWLVPVDTPVIEYVHRVAQDEVVEKIARYVSALIEDGSTLQVGLGRIASEVPKYLLDHKDLGVHSGMITDAIIPLLESGVLTGRYKSQQPHKIVTSLAMGTRRLYDLLDRNPRFCFLPIDVVCYPGTIAAQHKMVSVTQAFAIDLSGQVCADQFHGAFYSGVAAQQEFLRGASWSEGGKPIICLKSTEDDGETSCIRAVLRPGEGVSIPRTDVHYVVTEYGVAYLFGKSIRERAVALIGIANPKFRTALFAEAEALGYLPPEQALKNLQAYPIEHEATVVLKDHRSVLLRPAVASDAETIRQLFHQLSDRDVYTRFFHKVCGLSNLEVQRLCNVSFENEVAFVAVVGSRENPQVVAHGMYVIDPETRLAETAFMVHPQWQACGMGTALQHHMAVHAAMRGVQGFVAEILCSNERMIRLAHGGGANARAEDLGDTVRVTVHFDAQH